LDSTQKSIPPPNLFIRLLNSINRFFKLLKIISLQKPSYAIIFTADGLSFLEKSLFGFVCSISGCKTFLFPRAGNLINQINENRLLKFLCRILVRQDAHLLCQGPSWKDFGVSDLGYKESKIHVIPNWTLNLQEIQNAFEPINFYNKNIKIIFVGWLEKSKGVYELFNAFKIILEKGYSVELSFVGDGSEYFCLKQLAQSYKVNDSIRFYGWKKKPELLKIMYEHHIFILPSWSEGMSNAVIEALAVGLPTITTPVGVMRDFFTHDIDVKFIEPQNETMLVKTIEELLMNRKELLRLSKSGKNCVTSQFESQKVINNLIKVLRQAS